MPGQARKDVRIASLPEGPQPQPIKSSRASCKPHDVIRRCEKHRIRLDTQVTELDMEVEDDGRIARVGPYVVPFNRSEQPGSKDRSEVEEKTI